MPPLQFLESLKSVTKVWDVESQEWWYAVIEVIGFLTGDNQPSKRWYQMLNSEESRSLLSVCKQFPIEHRKGSQVDYLEFANRYGLLLIVQSVQSKAVEPLKQWLAMTGARQWKKLKMESDPAYIRFKQEWDDAIHQGTFDGLTVQDHLKYKRIENGNIRDHLTALELAFLILGEVTADEIIQKEKLQEDTDKLRAAQRGAQSAGRARKAYELTCGRRVVSRESNFAKEEI